LIERGGGECIPPEIAGLRKNKEDQITVIMGEEEITLGAADWSTEIQ